MSDEDGGQVEEDRLEIPECQYEFQGNQPHMETGRRVSFMQTGQEPGNSGITKSSNAREGFSRSRESLTGNDLRIQNEVDVGTCQKLK